MRKYRNILGFTLLELIVTLVILSILGTIAFLSIQSYTSNSRDSVRLTDTTSISKAITLSITRSGIIPQPSGTLTNITYSGATSWTQGAFGNSTLQSMRELNKVPTDPLTNKEYRYSVVGFGKEYEISFDYEQERLANTSIWLNTTYAATGKPENTHIQGSYNGIVLKTITGSTTCLLASPSISLQDPSVATLDYFSTGNNKLLYRNRTSASGIRYTPTATCTGSLNNNSFSEILSMFQTIQLAYSGSSSDIAGESNIANFLSQSGASLTNLGVGLIKNSLGGSNSSLTCTSSCPQVTDVCAGTTYSAPNGCGGSCNVIGTKTCSNPCILGTSTISCDLQ